MKILIFDDNERRRNAAEARFKGHDLTIVTTFDEAEGALDPYVDHGNIGAPFDVVLIPPPETHGDREITSGEIIAFFALTRGVKEIGCITEANH